jgi:hypothetical protein
MQDYTYEKRKLKRGEGGDHREIEKRIFRFVVIPNHSVVSSSQIDASNCAI